MALRINGQEIGDDVFLREFLRISGGRTPREVRSHDSASMAAMQQAAERQVLRATLLHQSAVKRNILVEEHEIEAERLRRWGNPANSTCGVGVRRELGAELQVEMLCRLLTRHVPRPSRAEVEEFYRRAPARFLRPEQVLAAHIVCRFDVPKKRDHAMKRILQARTELSRSRPFTEVANKFSDCLGNGGSLGWIGRGEMVREFDDVVFQLARRTASDIFETVFGLHIAYVQEHKAAGAQPLEEIRPVLARKLFEARRQAVIDAAVAQLVRESRIEIIEISRGASRDIAAGEKIQ